VEKILSQEEVDALLKGISSGEVQTEGHVEDDESNIVPVDLGRQERVIRSKIPFMEVLTDRFARQCRQTLTSSLRHMVDIALGSTEVKKFGDFLGALQAPTSIHIFRIEPLRGMAMLVLDSDLVYVLIELFMGGSGESLVKIEGREFTNIETRLIRKVAEALLTDLEKVWQPLHPVEVILERSENNPKLAAVLSPSDSVISIQLDVEIEVANGTLLLCLPYTMLEPFRDKLLLGDPSSGSKDTLWTAQLANHIRESAVSIGVELGRCGMTLQEVMDLQVEDTLLLDRSVGDLLELKVEGVPKFYCLPGQSKGKRAVKVDKKVSVGDES
jgi:flagellar motor switch protein FliM